MLYGNATLFRAEPTTGSGGARRNQWRQVNGQGPPLYPEGDGSQLYWSGVIKNYARALEGSQVQKLTWGVLVGVITCVGACVSVSAIRPHAFVFVLVFLLFDNLMLEFF